MMPPRLMELLLEAKKRRASDLHITQGTPPAVRVNGDIQFLPGKPLTKVGCEALVSELVDDEMRMTWRKNHQLSFSRTFPDVGVYRVNIYRQQGCFEACLRTSSERAHTLEELGIPKSFGDLATRNSGLVLVTGPTGHGKTTTFNALINVINRRTPRKILTIEDPVEFRHKPEKCLVVQIEVGVDSPDFATALKHALRQDPDVICVGELRDLESMATALTAAETGHLVIATLHTPTAVGTISRILDVFPADAQNQIRLQLSSALLGVLTQRLLPRADGLGRTLVCEVLLANEAVRNLIREGRAHLLPNTMMTHRSQGMCLLDHALRDLLQRGVITPETARRNATDPATLKDLL